MTTTHSPASTSNTAKAKIVPDTAYEKVKDLIIAKQVNKK